ncbi:MAG: ABC transporter ATP-binding protein [Pseudomonadota bacterium]
MNQPNPESGPPIDTDRPWLDPRNEPFIKIHGVSKRFGDFTAVDSVDLSVYKGELFSLLGGSGCGKTTLLRMLAGFEKPSSGTIHIDGVDMQNVPPHERPVNMMFQSYALFPHMTVENNVAYGLKRDGVAKAEIAERVNEMLTMVELESFAKRKPHQLSGGQRQRVALARSLVKRPKVLLLDEPLGALDKRLREQTQFELMNIQDKLGVTFIVVTHDQEEAMTLSTRIAVMDKGRFVQIGTPTEIYEHPETRFTANFIGTANMFDGRVVSSGADLVLTCPELSTPLKLPTTFSGVEGQPATLAVRPEKIIMSKDEPTDSELTTLKGTVNDLAYMGNMSVYRIAVEDDKVLQITAPNQSRRDQREIDWDDEVYVSWDRQNAIVLTH